MHRSTAARVYRSSAPFRIARMSSHYKAFFVVMILTVLAFWLARPVFIKFMSDDVYVRRRNLWLSLTFCAFLIPSFWLYMGVAGVLVWRAAKRDPNPAALYLFLLLVVPPFSQPISGFGLVNNLFPLDHFRLLGLALIVPAAIRMRRASMGRFNPQGAATGWLASDVFLIIYGILPTVLYFPYVSATGSLRSLFILGVDGLLTYYVLSRSCTSKPMIVEAVAAFVLSAVVLAPLALFEAAKGWLLYSDMAGHWGIDSNVIGYLLRSDVLRAQVTSGHSIVLGTFYAVALTLWLYLQSEVTGFRRWLGMGAMAGGLLVAFSRGPWVGAVVCVFVFFALGPNAKTRVLKLVGVCALAVALLLVSPVGGSVIDHLPFIGTVDAGNVTYRQEVNDRSWMLIRQNPLFGSPYFANYLEDLRTGQGIIDLLNAYLSIAMAFGLVTLAAFALFLAAVILKCLKVTRMNARSDPDAARLGAALLASLVGTLVIINTVNNYLSVPYIYSGLAALMVAYSRIAWGAVGETAQTMPTPTAESLIQRGRFGLRPR
jgi:hypothetical protein